MAIQTDYTVLPTTVNEDGTVPAPAVYPDAYIRVLMARCIPGVVYLTVAVHEDKAARENGSDPVFVKEEIVSLDNLTGDIYPAAYGWLKTLPEFENATDC